MKTDKKKSLKWELIRFAITGVVCALFDYLVCQLVIMGFNAIKADALLTTIISTGAGFVIGAGPASLTAAYDLLKKSDIKPVILEKSNDIGGISKTVKYNGNRMDIGGHYCH